ncbi:hypothetical protein ACOMHN_002342 [Nucella lapillus]
MSMMRARVQGHRWVDHPAAAVMKVRVPGQWVGCPAAVVMEAREQGRCWIDHPAVALRHQADGEARLLRGELTKEKIKLSQTRHQHFAALSPWMMGSTPVPSIPQGKDEAESAAA